MGVRSAVDGFLARTAVRRLHVLLAEVPGAWDVRAAAERHCRRRGWVVAGSPAGADVLLVCGPAPDDDLAEALEQVWASLPGPRARAHVARAEDLPETLDRLADDYLAAGPALDAGAAPPEAAGHGAPRDEGCSSHEGHDTGGHEGHDMGGHEGHDMTGPAGIPLASGGEDRDGLEMDVLHLQLGPVLPGWPPALTVVVGLQGDVVVDVDVRAARPVTSARVDAFRLDAAAQLLGLAGAQSLAARVRRVRDVRLGLDPTSAEASDAEPALVRRVERAWLLRRALRGVGVLTQPGGPEPGPWPAAWLGDAHDRLVRSLQPHEDAGAEVRLAFDELAAALPALLVGQELASARLLVASLVAVVGVSPLVPAGEAR